MANDNPVTGGHLQLPRDWKVRLAYGGLGGLTLVLVRAIQLGFYVGASSEVVIVGWLTLLGFAFISIIWALVTDERTPTKVYLSGLGAPSLRRELSWPVRLQFSRSQGMQRTQEPELPEVPVFNLFLPTLTAQETQTIETVDFGGENRLTDGLRASIVRQRPPATDRYLYLIGTTLDEVRAKEIAERLRRDLSEVFEDKGEPPSVQLLRPPGADLIFISIGYVQETEVAAENIRGNVLAAFLGRAEAPDEKTTELLGEGVVVGTDVAEMLVQAHE